MKKILGILFLSLLAYDVLAGDTFNVVCDKVDNMNYSIGKATENLKGRCIKAVSAPTLGDRKGYAYVCVTVTISDCSNMSEFSKY